MNKTTQNLLIGAAIVSIFSVGGLSTTAFAKHKNTFKCEGGNACKGHGACGEAKGKNACKGQGMAMVKDEKACDAAKAKNAPAAEKPAEAPAAETK